MKKFVALYTLTYYGPDIMARLYAGEEIPLELRGPELSIPPGKRLPLDFLISCQPSMGWLLDQGLILEVCS